MKLAQLLSALDEVAKPEGAQAQADCVIPDVDVTGVTADSRAVEPGCVFVAIPGSQVDGARFLPQAFEKGAVAALIGDHASIPPTLSDRSRLLYRVADPHLALARLASAFYPVSLNQVGAVTGTNGKTSIASFLRQIWKADGKLAANIGTIGIEGPNGLRYGGLTTPDPVGLMHSIQGLGQEGVTHLALEASSHGLEQKRLDCLRVDVGAFTNLTRDHLDYHGSLEAYRDAKSQLFSRLVRVGGTAVINLDDPAGEHFLSVARARGLHCLTVGSQTDGCPMHDASGAPVDLQIRSIAHEGFEQRAHLSGIWGEVDCFVPLIGEFQVSNALVAGLMAYAGGMTPDRIIPAIGALQGATGRMELVGRAGPNTAIYVDYSHTPDSLAVALKALRPFVKGRLIAVFGAGGDRDPGKRPMMGQAGNDFADYTIVTDDNPRSENPAIIRAAVMQAVTNGVDVDGRQRAITLGVEMMEPGDILLVAGKGHERGQTVDGEVLPFSDHEAIAIALAETGKGVVV